MNRLIATTFLTCSLLLAGAAGAQQRINPVDEPTVGNAPTAPDDANVSYDPVAIQQMMKLVSLMRLVGGGISQMFNSIAEQAKALDLIREAQTGRKNFPLLNDAEHEQAREGGEGLSEMSDSALNGAIESPPDVADAFDRFRTTFSLDQAFKLKDDELLGKKMLAQLAAKSAVAASSAEAAYKRANDSNVRLGDYIAALEASPDLKTSLDINTRVMIEMTQQSNESLRTQSAITSIASAYFMMLASEASEPSWVDGLKNFNR